MKNTIWAFFRDIFLSSSKNQTQEYSLYSVDKTIKYKQEIQNCYLDKILVAFLYSEEFRKHFLFFKYYQNKEPLTTYIKGLVDTLTQYSDIESIDIITSVPVSLFTRIFRWHNQSYVLAQEVAKSLHIPFVPLFRASLFKRSQAKALSKEQRKQNCKGMFSFISSILIKNKRILLIDDIISTWSTANELARQLKEKWAQEVTWLFLATRENSNL